MAGGIWTAGRVMKKNSPGVIAGRTISGKAIAGRARAVAATVREFEGGLLGKLLEGNSMGRDLEPGAGQRLLAKPAGGKAALENCARCGSCKARCPVYEITRNEAFSPRGRLMLLKGLAEGEIPPTMGLLKRLWSCALCGQCDVSCPVGIRPTTFIYRGREELRKLDTERLLLRTALRMSLRQPVLGLRAARFLGGLRYGFVKKVLPAGFSDFAARIPERRLGGEMQVIGPRKPAGRVAVFAGCTANYLMPETGEALVAMLVSMGYEVVMPRGEVCCGMPLKSLGLVREAERFAAKNIEIFGKLNVEAVIIPCPTCADMIKNRYPELAGVGIEKATDSAMFFLKKLAEGGRPDAGQRPFTDLMVWHEPCHLKHGLGFNAGPMLDLLGIERPGDEGCCGLGAYLTDRGMSEELLSRRVGVYSRLTKGTGRVVTSCPGCRIQLERGGIKTAHILEVIEERFFPSALQQEAAK